MRTDISLVVVQTNMKVYFKWKNSSILKLEVLPDETIKDVAAKIQGKGGIMSAHVGLSKSSGSGDIMVLVCCMILQDHLTDGLELLYVNHSSLKINGLRDVGRGDIMSLACDVLFQHHVIKASYDFMGKSLSR